MQTTILFRIIVLITIFAGINMWSSAQTTDVPPAGFDVIILNNGQIIHGKVMEVGIYILKYKRTDIPDGPVYEIMRNEVYAISYRNQMSEYFQPLDSSPFSKHETVEIDTASITYRKGLSSTSISDIRHGEFRAGVGLIRNFSKVKEIEDYKGKSGWPSFHFSYLFPLNQNLDAGFALGLASFNYSDRSFSEYDQLLTDRDITETLMSFALIGKYNIDLDLFKLYFLTGVSYTNSSVRTEGKVTFTDDDRTVLIQGGARSGNLGIPFRAGFDVKIDEKFSAYADFGTGLALVQIGGVIKLTK